MNHEPASPAPDAPRSDGPLAPRDGLYPIAIDDSLVIYDPDAERAHRFNGSAAFVWERLDGTVTEDALATAIAEEFGVDRSQAGSDVGDLLASLRTENLLLTQQTDDGDDTTGNPAQARADRGNLWPHRPADGELSTGSTEAEVNGPETQVFVVVDWAVQFHCPDQAIRDHLDRRFASLARPVPATHRYDLARTEDELGISVRFEGRELARGRMATVLNQFVWDLNRLAAAPLGPLTSLHAAGIVHEGRVVVLPAEPESGKSTLVTGLVRAGAAYLSDETVAFDDDLVVHPYPKPITLDPGSFPLFPELEPDPDADLEELRHRGASWIVDPHTIRADAAATDPGRIDLVVFPRYEPGAEVVLRELSVGDAYVRFLPNTFNLRDDPAGGLARLAQLAHEVPTYELVHGDLDAAVDSVLGLATSI